VSKIRNTYLTFLDLQDRSERVQRAQHDPFGRVGQPLLQETRKRLVPASVCVIYSTQGCTGMACCLPYHSHPRPETVWGQAPDVPTTTHHSSTAEYRPTQKVWRCSILHPAAPQEWSASVHRCLAPHLGFLKTQAAGGEIQSFGRAASHHRGWHPLAQSPEMLTWIGEGRVKLSTDGMQVSARRACYTMPVRLQIRLGAPRKCYLPAWHADKDTALKDLN
jgi:hypothetical protein